MDALGYYGQRDMIPAYVDKAVRHKSLRDEDSAKMLDLVFKNQVFDIGYLCDFGGLTKVLGSSDGDTFASSYASAEKSAVSQRDSFLAKFEMQ